MRAPMANGTIEPRYELETGSGRPYRPPLRGSRRRVRRGGFYIRPNRAPASNAPSPNAPAVGARIARPKPGAIFARPSVDTPGSGGMWACRPTPPAVSGLRCTRKACGRAMRAPMANGTIEPRYELETGSGRPYRPPLRGSRRRVRRGGFYIRPMPPRRMHLRRTHAPTANGTIEPRRESGTGLSTTAPVTGPAHSGPRPPDGSPAARTGPTGCWWKRTGSSLTAAPCCR